MKLKLIAVGQKMPSWVEQGFAEYAKRLPSDCALELIELAPGHRAKNTSKDKAMQQEAQAIIKALRPQDHIVTLEIAGKNWSTEQLAD